mmetsp:Transcript_68646/g.178281  ORF Transcript_68646/g.178281 Transcript_68646/m.178281 type:complete len:237 (-) Transcript_68646:250-960(-)
MVFDIHQVLQTLRQMRANGRKKSCHQGMKRRLLRAAVAAGLRAHGTMRGLRGLGLPHILHMLLALQLLHLAEFELLLLAVPGHLRKPLPRPGPPGTTDLEGACGLEDCLLLIDGVLNPMDDLFQTQIGFREHACQALGPEFRKLHQAYVASPIFEELEHVLPELAVPHNEPLECPNADAILAFQVRLDYLTDTQGLGRAMWDDQLRGFHHVSLHVIDQVLDVGAQLDGASHRSGRC